VDGSVTRAKWALGTAVPRVWAKALGRAACAGPAVPGELPLGTGCAESEQPCAERIALSAEARIQVVKASTREIKLTSIFFTKYAKIKYS
jgi:hypothetical protein